MSALSPMPGMPPHPPTIQIPPQVGPSAGGGAGSEDQPIALLKQMIGLAQQYMGVEPDEQDKATMAKVLSTLQQYLAKDQADRDQMLGSPATARILRKAG